MQKNIAQGNLIPFVSVQQMVALIDSLGVEAFMTELAGYIEEDFKQWSLFDKSPRFASHSEVGVIELMPTSNGKAFSFKYVNGHPGNTRHGLQTVTAFGVLADVDTGYPVLLSEMTLLTALRTAATSALMAKYLAPEGADTMAMIGNGSQSEFQALAFKAMLGIRSLRLYDIEPAASRKLQRNLQDRGFDIVVCDSAQAAVEGARIITTCTADKRNATILTEQMVGSGVYINAIGGDCPGKTELDPLLLHRARVFVEYEPQTRIEGEIQQLAADFPVTEMWRVISGQADGRRAQDELLVFDGVGFAVEDFSALRYVYEKLSDNQGYDKLDMIADPDDPRDLFGMYLRLAPSRKGEAA
ncbi:ornithine cyclodeaminase [Shewanella salipaludis]|uniref:Ornithine cyclodeaminase n=1 Tax=Shewanella salipaludis TaxID=2723052 RepID=A0A972FUP2_9GAMM|nr:ornithine cyclodeaminase [Shewanella salipaludis]NMH65982.1 ornithine cyclodeaminase [Shewanella salipaludis]